MGESKDQYVKRTQKDYSMFFKLSLVSEIETPSHKVCKLK